MSSQRGQQDWKWAPSSAVRGATSAVGGGGVVRARGPIHFSECLSLGTVDEPRGSQLYQHDPALRHQLRSSSQRREKQQTRNNYRRRRAAFDGSGRAGHHTGGTRANPGAFWNRTERNRAIKECKEKHRGSNLGQRNTDTTETKTTEKLRV